MFLAFVLFVAVACVGGVMLGLWLWERSLSDTDEA